MIYTFSLHGAALFLIISTRKVKLSALNDYKANSAIVYTETAVILGLVIGLSIVLDYPNFFAFIGSTLIFTGGTTFLGLTFIPKVLASNLISAFFLCSACRTYRHGKN